MAYSVKFSQHAPTSRQTLSQTELEAIAYLAFAVVNWHHYDTDLVVIIPQPDLRTLEEPEDGKIQCWKIQVPIETNLACTGSLNIIERRINDRDFDLIDPQASQGVPSIKVYSQPLGLPNSMDLATQRPWTLDILWEHETCTVTATAMSKAIDFVQMERLARQTLAGIVALLQDSTQGIKDLDLLHSEDNATVRKWNSATLPVDRGLIHEKIDSSCRSFPQHEAVAAWDISLSYAELQQTSSNLAKHLLGTGIGRGEIVAVCMEKGAAVVVALLAVLKAGATILPLTTTYPSERLHRICSLAQPKLIIVDDSHGSYLATAGWNVQHVEYAHFDRNASFWEPIRGECDDIAYVCFTSGSTGNPKGCKISHSGFCTAARAVSQAVHYDSNSRIFHWASFAFDVSLLRIFHTLFVGGTVCMPNEKDQMKDLTNTLNYFKATHLEITPSASMLISPKELSSLQHVTLAGETIAPEALALWRDHVHLTNGYGPTECSVSSSQEHDFSRIELGSIGKPTSCRYWVMNRACPEKLAPVGALGELLIEGPNVGAGYLNNESETRRSFVHRPESLDKYSIEKFPSYWTGDFVKSMEDGSVIFCGRADNQVKIRGQRVELGEIHRAIHDSGLLAGRSAVVDVVYPDDEPQQNYLTLFVEFPAISPEYADSFIAEDSGVVKAEIDALARNVPTELSRILPLHMVPTVFLPVTTFPKTASGKIDRKRLRRGGGTKATKRRLLRLPDGPVVSEAENTPLLNIISSILGVNLSSQQLDRSFLSVGGDSLRAIRLVSKLREEGRAITVAEILGRSSLASIKDLLESRPRLSQVKTIDQSPTTALSLLDPALNRRNVVEEVAKQCGTTPSNVEDVFPCTPLQESLVLASMRRKHAYWMFQSFRLKHQANSEHVRQSWLRLCDAAPLLRTRIVLIDGQKIYQVKLRTQSRFTVLQDDLKQVEEMAWKETEFNLGAELAVCSLVQDQYLVVRTHHAVLDGWSLSRTMMSFDRLLSGFESLYHADFRLFVKYCRDVRAEDHCRAWWQNYLSRLPASYSFVEREAGTLTDSMFEFEEGLERSNALEFTLTTYVRTAFGLLIGAYSNTADVVFGTIASGKTVPIPGIVPMCGPTICLTPFRVQWNSQSRLEQLLSYVHESTLAMSDVEQVGVESIQSWLLQSEKKTCQLPNLLVVQPDDGFEKGNVLKRLPGNMNVRLLHDLNFEVIPVKDRVKIRVRFEQTSIDLSMLARIVRQFHTILQRLLRLDPSCKIAKAFEAPEPEKLSMLNTNHSIHALHECCIHDLVDASARKFHTKLAVDAHDGIWSYGELHKESERIATGLALWGVKAGSSVICVLERSKWAVATMLAILKQGAHCVALAANSQQPRADRIVAATGAAHFVVAEELFRRLQFQPQNIRTPQQLAEAEGSFQHCEVAPESTAFIMFSSGTTGEPKGIKISHQAFCTSAAVHATALRLDAESRALHFSAYTFDHTLFEFFTTLLQGGCVCIPSESDRLSDLEGYMARSRVSWAFITPTVAQVLNPDKLTSMKTLALGGELIPQQIIDRWSEKVEVVVGYGPTECSMCLADGLKKSSKTGDIGFPTACCAWVVHPDDASVLMPYGSIGELIIEGFLLADGYCSDVTTTTDAWLPPQQWCPRGQVNPPFMFRTGDLVRYKEDGSLVLIGRKDTLVKLHGQRIDVAAIENQVMKAVEASVAIDVIDIGQTQTEYRQWRLVCFVQTGEPSSNAFEDHLEWLPEVQSSRVFEELVRYATQEVEIALPHYMVPTSYVAICQLPRSLSGKLNRRLVRNKAQALPKEAFISHEEIDDESIPNTESESLLQRAWTDVLSLPPEKIGRKSHFFHLGGDSMSSIRLTALLRQRGALLTAEQVLRTPVLEAQAAMLVIESLSETPQGSKATAPFSLLQADDEDRTTVVKEVAEALEVDVSEIEDLYAATPLQEGLWAMSVQRSGAYMSKTTFKLSNREEAQRFIGCCEEAAKHIPILRTTLLPRPGRTTLQVVLKSTDSEHSPCAFVVKGKAVTWCIHHAFYDGPAWTMILQTVRAFWQREKPPSLLPFSTFVQYLQRKWNSATTTRQYWRSVLGETQLMPFPAPRSSKVLATASRLHQLCFKRPAFQGDVAFETVLQVAFAMLLKQHANGEKVVFGNVRHGRSAGVSGIERVAGPTVAVVPVYIAIDPEETVTAICKRVHLQNLSMIPHEHYGLTNIKSSLPDTFRGNADFQTLLNIHKSDSSVFAEAKTMWNMETDLDESFYTYSLIFMLAVDEQHVYLSVSFDPAALDAICVAQMVEQYEQLSIGVAAASMHTRCCDIGLPSPQQAMNTVRGAARDSTEERRMHELWGLVLKRDEDSIGRNDSFFSLGGDSIRAMQLASTKEYQQWRLGAAEIMNHPTIREQCDLLRRSQPDGHWENLNHSLGLGSPPTRPVKTLHLRNMASKALRLQLSEIEDVYSCTPLQIGMISLSARNPEAYWARLALKETLGEHELERFSNVWDSIQALLPALRTCIVLQDDELPVQVVLRKNCPIETLKEGNQRLDPHRIPTSRFITDGIPLVRCAFRKNAVGWTFCLTIHHSVYDRGFINMFSNMMRDLLKGKLPGAITPFCEFVETHASQCNTARSRAFWRKHFSGIDELAWPPRSRHGPASTDAMESASFTLPVENNAHHSIVSTVRASWALLLSLYNNCRTIVFGEVLSGRMFDTEIRTAGPTIATVPVKVGFESTTTVADILVRVNDFYVGLLPFQQTGLQGVAKMLDEHDRHAIDFKTLLVINSLEDPEERTLDTWEDEDRDIIPSHPYTLVLEFNIRGLACDLNVAYDSRELNSTAVNRLARQLGSMVAALWTTHPDTPFSRLKTASADDRTDILRWNSPMPEPVHETIQGLIRHQATKFEDRLAIDGWDGRFTYMELDGASDRAARYLLQNGCRPSSAIAFLFEKSKFAVVAMLAIMKIGAAFVPLDPNQPQARLQNIMDQAEISTVISPRMYQDLANTLCPSAFNIDAVVEPTLGTELAPSQYLEDVSPSAVACILFTSGTTGSPKGILLEHRNLATHFMVPRETVRSPNAPSRLLQFSAYTFDVGIGEVFMSLARGDTLCIPSETERLASLQDCFRKYAITEVTLTPSVADLLDPTQLPDLYVLRLGGEPLPTAVVAKWVPHVKLTNGYGPAECSILASIAHVNNVNDNPARIGKPTACLHWIVDPEDHDILLPVGAVGELIIEGPIVGRGYIDTEQSRKSFLSQPPLSTRMIENTDERRFYKTGDLVRYDWDGCLLFHGRKDAQIKLNGQRLELGEAESKLRQALPVGCQVAVDVVTSESDRPILCAFIAPSWRIQQEEDFQTLTSLWARLKSELLSSLPSYMVPSRFEVLETLPRNASGKLDRRALKGVKLNELPGSENVVSGRECLSPVADKLRARWAQCLKLRPSAIGPNGNFFQLGGDSISAMRLAALARSSDICLTVSEIFQNPTLKSMAGLAQDRLLYKDRDSIPFQLMRSGDHDEIRRAAATICQIGEDEIEDVFPCTPLQEGLMAASEIGDGAYVLKQTFALPPELDHNRLVNALTQVVRERPIMRTRIVQIAPLGSLQTIVKEPFWKINDQITTPPRSFYGRPLNEFSITNDNLTWLTHHAVYDAYTQNLIKRDIVDAYHGDQLVQGVAFRDFVYHVLDVQHIEASRNFWREYLSGCIPPSWPPSTPGERSISTREGLTHTFELPNAHLNQFTDFTHVKLAWALLLGQYTGASSTLFATTLSGRDTMIRSDEMILGPTIATVPVSISWESEQTVEDALTGIQISAAHTLEHQHVGLSRIAALVRDEFEFDAKALTLLLMQNNGDTIDNPFSNLGISEYCDGELFYTDFPLVIEFAARKEKGVLQLHYDGKSISRDVAARLSRQLAHVLIQIRSAQPATMLGLIDLVSAEEKSMLAKWAGNSSYEEHAPSPHDRFITIARQNPTAVAIHAWDGTLSYRDAERQSSSLARYFESLGIAGGDVVALCLQKSKMVIIAMYALWRLGAAFATLDLRDPSERMEELASRVDAKVIVTNVEEYRGRFKRTVYLDDSTSLYSDPLVDEIPKGNTIAYIMFTSGTTGRPKGVAMSQKALSTWAFHAGTAFMFDRRTRTLQSTRLTFDPSIAEIVGTLYHGGCVCIPNENECLGNLFETAVKYDANYVQTTPSVLKTQPVPSHGVVKTVFIVGEVYDLQALGPWIQQLPIWNAYGPTETCINVARAPVTPSSTKPNLVSSPSLGRFWVANTTNFRFLAPIGCLGELLIEGPMLADGYWQDPKQTSAAFIHVPEDWPHSQQTHESSRRLYRTGDLVRYLSDGSLQICGRMDKQVKISGQRVELEEVEAWLTRSLVSRAPEMSGIVDLVPFQNSSDRRLTIFIVQKASITPPSMQIVAPMPCKVLADQSSEETLRRSMLLQEIRDDLAKQLPRHMIPTGLLHLSNIPLARTGKRDRRALATLVQTVPVEYASPSNDVDLPNDGVEDERELIMFSLWREAIGISTLRLTSMSRFSKCGGDSISAMRLVALARKRGLSINAAEILRTTRLKDMAKLLAPAESGPEVARPRPFHLLDKDTLSQVWDAVRSQIGLTTESIEDALPLTPMQGRFLTSSLKFPGDSVAQYCFALQSVRTVLIQQAVRSLLATSDALRIRFVTSDAGTFQVITAANQLTCTPCTVYRGKCEKAHKEEGLAMLDSLGTPLCRFAICESDTERGCSHLILTCHHSIYDGWSIHNITERLRSFCRNPESVPVVNFTLNQLVEHYMISSRSKDTARFWEHHLSCADARSPCKKLGNTPIPLTNSSVEVEWVVGSRGAFTLSSQVHLSLAMALRRATGSPRPVIATTLTGRTPNLAGMDDFIGPAAVVVPTCVVLVDPKTQEDLSHTTILQSTQDFLNSLDVHGHYGYDAIAQLNDTTKAACQTATHLVVHPVTYGKNGGLSREDDPSTSSDTPQIRFEHACLVGKERQALNIESTPLMSTSNFEHRIAITARFDERFIPNASVSQLVEYMGVAFQTLQGHGT